MKNLSNPFSPDSTNEKLFNHGKEVMLSRIIQNFPNVAKADVMIDPTREIHVSNSIDPSATVTLTMQDGAPANQQLVDAAADVVQGAQSGLARSRIKVVVGGVPRRLHDTDNGNDIDGAGSDVLELQQKAELTRESQIKDCFSYIPDLKVFVTVKVNATSTQEHSQNMTARRRCRRKSKPPTTRSRSTNPASGSAEAGVVSNGGLAVNGPAAGSGSTNAETKETADFQNFVPSKDTNTVTPAGEVSVIAATVRVPMAYFEAIYTPQSGCQIPYGRAAPTADRLGAAKNTHGCDEVHRSGDRNRCGRGNVSRRDSHAGRGNAIGIGVVRARAGQRPWPGP